MLKVLVSKPQVQLSLAHAIPLARNVPRDPASLLDAGNGTRLAVIVNGDLRACLFTLPLRDGYRWVSALEPSLQPNDLSRPVPGRTVIFMIERQIEGQGKGP